MHCAQVIVTPVIACVKQITRQVAEWQFIVQEGGRTLSTINFPAITPPSPDHRKPDCPTEKLTDSKTI